MLTIINDCHLLAQRSAGTTPQSNEALHQWVLQQFAQLLHKANGADLLINGDLFDRAKPTPSTISHQDRNISTETHVMMLLANWCKRNSDHKLLLSAGNHDLPRNNQQPSAFGNLCDTLSYHYPNAIRIDGDNYTHPNLLFTVVPHYANQELFDQALERVLAQPDRTPYVFVHANYDNHFAQMADHSLNISQEMAQRFKQKGITLVFGHEHHARQIDNVHIVGNQIPTSIADCLGTRLVKQYAELDYHTGQLFMRPFLTLHDVYRDVDWTSDTLPDVHFIRITGQADISQAAEVVSKIAQWRKTSNAFVISHAVQLVSSNVQETAAHAPQSQYDIWQQLLNHIPQTLHPLAQEIFKNVEAH